LTILFTALFSELGGW